MWVSMYDGRKMVDVVLALMHLNAVKDNRCGWRAWKSFPWEATDGLYERGLLSDPKSEASRCCWPTRASSSRSTCSSNISAWLMTPDAPAPSELTYTDTRGT